MILVRPGWVTHVAEISMFHKKNLIRVIAWTFGKFNTIPNDKILDWSKLKAFADVKNKSD